MTFSLQCANFQTVPLETMFKLCKMDCCEGDLCNTDNTAVSVSGLVASVAIAAVLLALFLNCFQQFSGVYVCHVMCFVLFVV